jgi:ABC-type transporter Mla subunit MlaD
VPIAEIGQNLRQITGRFRTLVSSPEVDDSLHKLDSTLTSVDQIAREAKPQVGPLIVKLNKVADEVSATASAARGMLNGDGADQDSSLPDALRQLTEAARSIRSLADYLGRHPEALLKGKAKDAQ